jgi:cobaltochelatase CobT
MFKIATRATLRAISRKTDIEISFYDGNPDRGGEREKIPSPPNDLNYDGVAETRGASDAWGLWLRHHDPGVHARHAPPPGVASDAFDGLEQARCEAVGTQGRMGILSNISLMLEHECRRRGVEYTAQFAPTTLVVALRVLAREALMGEPVPPAARSIADHWCARIGPQLLRSLEGLRRHVGHQTEFAREARRILANLMAAPDFGRFSEDDWRDSQETAVKEGVERRTDPGGDVSQTRSPIGEGAEQESVASNPAEDSPRDDPTDRAESAARGVNRASPSPRPDAVAYHPFSRQFDEIASAADFLGADELARLRRLLDQRAQPFHRSVALLANRLRRRLQALQTRCWQFDLEEGLLDVSRLPRIIADPAMALSFKQEKQARFPDTVVTLLLDNSGSMRGQSIVMAAICADILAQTLERCGVKVEILGFTTRAWKGGLSRELWTAAGSPPQPGRLNDLRHIIYKAADTPWRRARQNLGLMLQEDLLKENIDSEALLWAHSRLLRRAEERRVLIVISDGFPADDSTRSTNAPDYLERHLREVIRWIETSSPVELVAIGIGHDVRPFYAHAVTLYDVAELGGKMLDQVAELFGIENVQ